MIGNDVVDLHDCEPPAYQHVAFLNRVCSRAEVQWVRSSGEPSMALAALWAAKEAAYKLISKKIAGCHFVPRQFETHFQSWAPHLSDTKSVVRNAGIHCDVHITATQRWIHAVALETATCEVRWAVRERKNCFMQGRPAGGESEAARSLAKNLLGECGIGDAVLEFTGRVPKVRQKLGSSASIGISLSHHGAFVAAAIAWRSVDSSLPIGCRRRFAELSQSEGVCSTSTA